MGISIILCMHIYFWSDFYHTRPSISNTIKAQSLVSYIRAHVKKKKKTKQRLLKLLVLYAWSKEPVKSLQILQLKTCSLSSTKENPQRHLFLGGKYIIILGTAKERTSLSPPHIPSNKRPLQPETDHFGVSSSKRQDGKHDKNNSFLECWRCSYPPWTLKISVVL